jgi:hypothetical protein
VRYEPLFIADGEGALSHRWVHLGPLAGPESYWYASLTSV